MKYLTLCLSGFLALCLLFSCGKVNESIQRDVVLTGDSSTFTIPIITDTIASVKLGPFSVKTDLDALIKSQTSDFSAADILNIRISQLNVKLSDTNRVNTLENFQSLDARILADGKDSLALAARNDNPESIAVIINLPIINGAADLKPYLMGTNPTYIIKGILRHATTKTLKATVTPIYRVTLGM